jgi:signal peptidase I
MRNRQQRSCRNSGTNFLQRWALNIGALLGTVCLLVSVLTLVFGLKPLVFTSGSMGPVIPTGSLGLAVPMPVAEVMPGQVVSVVNSDGTRVTHRVVETRQDGLILKGDANSTADLQPYQVETADRLLLSVPVLGYVVSWFSQPWAFFVGGLLCAYLLYLAFFRRGNGTTPVNESSDETSGSPAITVDFVRDGTPEKKRIRHRRWMGVTAAATSLAVVLPLAIAIKMEPTHAAFNATAQASAGFAAAIMARPASVKCAQGEVGSTTTRNQTIVFTWQPPLEGSLDPTEYLISVQVNNADGSPSATNDIEELRVGSERTFSLDTLNNKGLLSSLLGALIDLLVGYDRTVTVKISAIYPSGWSSQPVIFNKVNATNGGLLGAPKKLTCTVP